MVLRKKSIQLLYGCPYISGDSFQWFNILFKKKKKKLFIWVFSDPSISSHSQSFTVFIRVMKTTTTTENSSLFSSNKKKKNGDQIITKPLTLTHAHKKDIIIANSTISKRKWIKTLVYLFYFIFGHWGGRKGREDGGGGCVRLARMPRAHCASWPVSSSQKKT